MRSAGLAALGGCWDGSLQGQLGGAEGQFGRGSPWGGSNEEHKGQEVVDQVWDFGASFELSGVLPLLPVPGLIHSLVPHCSSRTMDRKSAKDLGQETEKPLLFQLLGTSQCLPDQH